MAKLTNSLKFPVLSADKLQRTYYAIEVILKNIVPMILIVGLIISCGDASSESDVSNSETTTKSDQAATSHLRCDEETCLPLVDLEIEAYNLGADGLLHPNGQVTEWSFRVKSKATEFRELKIWARNAPEGSGIFNINNDSKSLLIRAVLSNQNAAHSPLMVVIRDIDRCLKEQPAGHGNCEDMDIARIYEPYERIMNYEWTSR